VVVWCGATWAGSIYLIYLAIYLYTYLYIYLPIDLPTYPPINASNAINLCTINVAHIFVGEGVTHSQEGEMGQEEDS